MQFKFYIPAPNLKPNCINQNKWVFFFFYCHIAWIICLIYCLLYCVITFFIMATYHTPVYIHNVNMCLDNSFFVLIFNSIICIICTLYSLNILIPQFLKFKTTSAPLSKHIRKNYIHDCTWGSCQGTRPIWHTSTVCVERQINIKRKLAKSMRDNYLFNHKTKHTTPRAAMTVQTI